jgi:hypothetical protein
MKMKIWILALIAAMYILAVVYLSVTAMSSVWWHNIIALMPTFFVFWLAALLIELYGKNECSVEKCSCCGQIICTSCGNQVDK